MSRIVTPSTIEASPAASQDLLKVVQKQLGGVPNMFRLIGVSPASLEGYLGLSGALARGQLDPRTPKPNRPRGRRGERLRLLPRRAHRPGQGAEA